MKKKNSNKNTTNKGKEFASLYLHYTETKNLHALFNRKITEKEA